MLSAYVDEIERPRFHWSEIRRNLSYAWTFSIGILHTPSTRDWSFKFKIYSISEVELQCANEGPELFMVVRERVLTIRVLSEWGLFVFC
jgi:hypothetical protein